jgi:6-pyruvoyltetrahydropterin/6-carboxytetrahydropterin synthase
VTAVVRGGTLDDDGLLCDFHELQRALEAVLAPLRDGDLNATPPFDEINPTAENVARHIAAGLSQRLAGRASIARVTVTEAPGCAATYIVAR